VRHQKLEFVSVNLVRGGNPKHDQSGFDHLTTREAKLDKHPGVLKMSGRLT
jgi:hypothetical protein